VDLYNIPGHIQAEAGTGLPFSSLASVTLVEEFA